MRLIICCIVVALCSVACSWSEPDALQARLSVLEVKYRNSDATEARRVMLDAAFLLENESKGKLSELDRAEHLLKIYARLYILCAERLCREDEAFLYYREARYWFMRTLMEEGLAPSLVADRVRGYSEQSAEQFVLSHDASRNFVTRECDLGREKDEKSSLTSSKTDQIYHFPRGRYGDRSLGGSLDSLVLRYLEGSAEQARQAIVDAIVLIREDSRGVWESAFGSLLDVGYSRLHCIAIAEGDEVDAFLNCEEALYWYLKYRQMTCTVGDDITCISHSDFGPVARLVRKAVSDEQWCRNSLLLDIPNRDGRLPAYAEGGDRLKPPIMKLGSARTEMEFADQKTGSAH